MKNFARGIKLHHRKKRTEGKPILEASEPNRVVIPLQQNLGCPAEPLVKVGDEVEEGQKIGDSTKFIFAPIHASIPGKVTKIEWVPNVCGFDAPSIIIERTKDQLPITNYKKDTSLEKFTPEEIRTIVREAGIVGLGGATFPTHVKLAPPKDKHIQYVIVNGCECEPFITIDHRLMLEKAKEILFGAQAVAKAVSAKKIIVAIEKNKPDAISTLKGLTKSPDSEVVTLDTKYPQGGEKMLIKSVLNKEVPSRGLPSDVGVVVINVGTAIAISEAINNDTPLIKRGVTVTGSGIKEAKNLYVKIGTPFGEVINQCGGLTDDVAKIVMGGPMTGLPVSSLDMPVVKATSCILVLNKKDAEATEEGNCIRCGRCIQACPMGLLPNFLGTYSKAQDWEKADEYNVADCIECGCCSYVCPSRIYLVQYFKIAKRELQTRKSVCR